MRISLNVQSEKPKWWYKVFTCRHEIVHIETNPFSKYGTKSSYLMCIKCGKRLFTIRKQCKHEENCFGLCKFCNERLSNFENDHEHNWINESELNDKCCNICGEWYSEIYGKKDF